MIMLDKPQMMLASSNIKIKILGVGGAGSNAVETLILENFLGVECCILNTDLQALAKNKVDHKIQLGTKSIHGIGTGANPEIGKLAAEEDIELILDLVEGADIVFLVGGLGGGTGSGALPIIAKILQEKQILSIALVTKPFIFEGNRRMNIAQQALEKLEQCVDTLLVIPNQKLFETDKDHHIPLVDAFNMVNKVICNCIKTVVDTIQNTGHINVDFADIKATMTRMGKAVMGIGRASGENRAQEAINGAIASPLLEHTSLKGARSILLNITGSKSLSLHEMSIIAGYVHDQAHPEAHIIVGSAINEQMDQDISVTIIATGFDDITKMRTVNKQPQFYNTFNGYQPHTPQASYSNKQYRTESTPQENIAPSNYSSPSYARQPNLHSVQMKVKTEAEHTENNLEIPTILRKLMHDQNQ